MHAIQIFKCCHLLEHELHINKFVCIEYSNLVLNLMLNLVLNLIAKLALAYCLINNGIEYVRKNL